MRKILLTLAALTSHQAHAQVCIGIEQGYLKHRPNFLVACNVRAFVTCSRHAPRFVYWPGGAMCSGSKVVGRDRRGRRYSCWVRAFIAQ